MEEHIEKRHRGRPKGVKNRPREPLEEEEISVFETEYELQEVRGFEAIG